MYSLLSLSTAKAIPHKLYCYILQNCSKVSKMKRKAILRTEPVSCMLGVLDLVPPHKPKQDSCLNNKQERFLLRKLIISTGWQQRVSVSLCCHVNFGSPDLVVLILIWMSCLKNSKERYCTELHLRSAWFLDVFIITIVEYPWKSLHRHIIKHSWGLRSGKCVIWNDHQFYPPGGTRKNHHSEKNL